MKNRYFRIISVSFIVIAFLVILFVILPKDSLTNKYLVTFINKMNIPTSLYPVAPENKETEDGHGGTAKKIADINETKDLSLPSGKYCLSANSKDYINDAMCFEVTDKSTSVTIDPNFSKEHLADLLQNEQLVVRNVIKSKYKEVISNFELGDDRLFMKGEWYGISLTQKVPDPSDRGDVYLSILEKVDGKWITKDVPRLSVNKYQLPDVPTSILDEVNRMPGVH